MIQANQAFGHGRGVPTGLSLNELAVVEYTLRKHSGPVLDALSRYFHGSSEPVQPRTELVKEESNEAEPLKVEEQ